MIFCSKNEEGTPKWQQVIKGTVDVTRRTKPQPIGAIRAVQSNRGKKAVGYIKIIDCVPDDFWCDLCIPLLAEVEAQREGFKTWEGLWECIKKMHGQTLPQLYRIEFKLVSMEQKVSEGE